MSREDLRIEVRVSFIETGGAEALSRGSDSVAERQASTASVRLASFSNSDL